MAKGIPQDKTENRGGDYEWGNEQSQGNPFISGSGHFSLRPQRQRSGDAPLVARTQQRIVRGFSFVEIHNELFFGDHLIIV